MMEILFNYITTPGVIVNFIVFVFWLWVIYSKMNTKIDEIEKRIEKIEDLDLDARLTKLQTDMDWVRLTLDKYLKK